MALKSFNAYHSFLRSMEQLNDAERGRLFTALLEYSETGVEPDLRGNERFVFPALREQIDRDKRAYEAKCAKNKANVGKRWNTTVYEGLPNDTKHTKDKDKDKDKDNISSSSLSPSSLRPLGNDDDDLISVVRLWEKASGRVSSLLQKEELLALLEEYTAEQVCNAIRSASQHNAVNLAYVKAVLSGKPKPQAGCEKEYSPEMQRWLRGESV